MATQTITLSLEAGTTNLILTDNQGHSGKNITTDAGPGDKVIWEILNGSGISEIVSIYCEPGSVDVFSPDPSPQGSSGKWSGTVADSAKGDEQYGIKYKVGDTVYDVDPFIKVKTGDGG